jgi:hypothetical protein
MANLQFPSWNEQQSLFKLSCADVDTCNQLSSVVSPGLPVLTLCSQSPAHSINRITRCLISGGLSLTWGPRRWPFRALQKELSRRSPLQADSTVDMSAVRASLADRGRQNALGTSLGVETAGKPALSAAILTAKEKSPNGGRHRSNSWETDELT